MEELFFEELEKVEELGAINDFAGAAQPWVLGGFTIAIALVT